MGLSNYLPSSRLIQPGVIANSGERPASPYEGMVIYQKDTNQTLVWDGSAWVMVHDTDQPPGMQLITPSGVTGGTLSGATVTINSAVSTITVSGVFSNTYENYKIVVSFDTMSNNGSTMYMTIGPSITTGYYSATTYNYYNAGTYYGTNVNNGAQWNIGYSGTEGGGGFIEIQRPEKTKRTTAQSSFSNSQIAAEARHFQGNTTAATEFSILSAGGFTMTGGTIRVYGYRD